MGLIYEAKLDLFYLKWRRRNRHNDTAVRCMFPMDRVKVGNRSYGELYVLSYNDRYTLQIGNFVSIGSEVTFILSADHALNHVSTFPYKTKVISGETEGISRGDIIVDDDAWIGHGATILSGVHIGQGAVIAAGAVVNRDVPPYTVAGGVPAKTIRNRFSQEVTAFLQTLDYALLNDDMIRAHEEELYSDLDRMPLSQVQEMFAWFPKKPTLR